MEKLGRQHVVVKKWNYFDASQFNLIFQHEEVVFCSYVFSFDG